MARGIPAPPSAGRTPFGPAPIAAIGVMTLIGALLRIAAARGDLWLDEIWSFRLLSQVHTIPQIVFALPYDTNHVLTEIWLALVGPAAPPLLVRLPAILYGTLCIPVAAYIGARRGPVAALAAAAVFAVDYVFIHFGSEARGYAGMILATLVAFAALDGLVETPSARGRIIFTLAIGFGTFSHLTMIEATAALCASAIYRVVRTAGWHRALPRVTSIVAAAVIGTAPALLCFVLSVLATGTLHTGLSAPPSFAASVHGQGRTIGGVIGLYDGPAGPAAMALLVGVTMLGGALAVAALTGPRQAFAAVAILMLPWLHALLPNQSFPRFHLTLAVALALLIADVWSVAWTRGRAARAAALCAAILFFIGQYGNVSTFLEQQRGHYKDAVALMSETAPTRFSALPRVQDGETSAIVQWYARQQGVNTLTHIAIDAPCTTAPDWMIIVQTPSVATATPPTMVSGPAACQATYALRAIFPAFGYSGSIWALYRRD